jgi:MFS family permease
MNNNNIPSAPWYKDMSRYHWFVFIVCCLGWGLDCFDQQIFNLMRNPALADLMGLDPTHANVTKMGGLATSIMLLGWGFGGILFGVMADKFGRARMMIITILVYAIFTGLCGLATSWWDFFLYRFLCGMGVGGQFAAGVTLLAETVPDNARPKSLGLLQIVAAFCNLCAASLALFGGILEGWGYFSNFPLWRSLFLVGFIPALLAFVVMRRLEEPKAWKEAIASGGVKKAGSIPDLFRNPRWRYNVIVGMCLATCGVIGLWGIGFFSVDLTRTTFRVAKNQEARERGDVEALDFELIRMLAGNPKEFLPIVQEKKLTAQSFIGSTPKTNEAGAFYLKFVENNDYREKIFDQPPLQTDKAEFERLAAAIAERSQSISSYVTFWGSITSLLFNLGAVIGTWGITLAAERWGRRIAFTMFFGASFFMTILVFLTMDTELEVLIMQPILGFCILSLFGGYAIYFPELFPTRLRSTAISFCYNIARFVSALGPAGLGILTAYVFHDTDEPIRWAGAAMSVTFIFGILFAWLGPATKGKPFPEE